jgi:hypothetical protein
LEVPRKSSSPPWLLLDAVHAASVGDVAEALAAPTAHGPFRLVCEKLPAGEAGRTILPDGVVVEISPDMSFEIGRVIRHRQHRHVSVGDAARYMGLLTAESVEIAMYCPECAWEEFSAL